MKPQLQTTPVARKSISANPPRSAPTRSHYTSSRLERLAAPRPSSSWKKPIKSKLQRRHNQFACSNSSWEHVVIISKRLSEDQEKVNKNLDDLHDMIERKSSESENNIVQDDWNDCYSASGGPSDSILNKSQDEKVYSLEQQIDELKQLLAARDKTIVELEARLRMNGQDSKPQDFLAASDTSQSLSTINSPAHAQTSTYDQTNTRESLDSIGRQGSFNDLFNKLSIELDSQLYEIKQMSTDHEARVDMIQTTTYNREFFELDPQVTVNGDTSCSSKMLKANENTDATICAKAEALSTSLAKIKEEHESLISDYHNGCKEFKAAFEQNCVKIMNYVREELESEHFPVKELQSYNEALQYELEVIRWENAELKSELQRRKDESDITVAVVNTPDKKLELEHFFVLSPMKSPLPTIESWAQFCTRFQEAVAGKNVTIQKKKLVLDDNATKRADRMFRELAFAQDSTPFQKRSLGFSDRDVFSNAVS